LEDDAPYYLSCLQGISELRKSEALQTVCAVELSEGKTSMRDIETAYKYFGFDRYEKLDEDHVIGAFNSRLDDAPKQETEMRQSLALIGKDKKSAKIRDVAAKTSQFAHNLPHHVLPLTFS